MSHVPLKTKRICTNLKTGEGFMAKCMVKLKSRWSIDGRGLFSSPCYQEIKRLLVSSSGHRRKAGVQCNHAGEGGMRLASIGGRIRDKKLMHML
jgi:hypothetical protein